MNLVFELVECDVCRDVVPANCVDDDGICEYCAARLDANFEIFWPSEEELDDMERRLVVHQ